MPSSGLSLLLIDDNPRIAESLSIAARLGGHRLDAADSAEEGYSRLAATRYDAVLLDLNYTAGRTGGEEGLAVLARILRDDPAACVVVITAHSGIRIAVAAMQAGARDFVMKPWRNADLLARVATAVAREQRPGATRPTAADAPARLLGDSLAIERVRDMIRRLAPTDAGIVVTGPSGSGRQLVAAALHAGSPHANTAMMRIDLRDPAAWARIDAADGTLLLRHADRIGEVEQARLLERLPAAVRCLTIADEARAIVPALARRIATVDIAVPPLHARDGDALLLARHFTRAAAARHGRAVPGFTGAAETLIATTRWPDEVRGLAAAIERAVLLGDGGAIDAAALAPFTPSAPVAPATRFDLDERERATIIAALGEHHHNVTHAAEALGLSRGALYRRMARHGL